MTDDSTCKLCKNTDCERYPDDENFVKENEEEYEPRGQWKKCVLCDGYFDDNGFNDILFIEEESNNQCQCDLCGKDENIVQMKGTGEYLCENGCEDDDESEEEEESDDDENEEEENEEEEEEDDEENEEE